MHRRWQRLVGLIGVLAGGLVTIVGSGGGGGGDEEPPPSTNAAPSAPMLMEASSVQAGSLDVSWLPSTDDGTPAEQIRYQVHGSTAAGFRPSSATLLFEGAGVASARISNGLTAGGVYQVRVLALDTQGASSPSGTMTVRVSDTEATLVPGARTSVLGTADVASRAPGTLTLAAGTATPAVGQVLANTDGQGFLRTVTAIHGNTVTTRATSLNEVLSEVRIGSAFSLSALPGQVRGQGGTNPQALQTSDTPRSVEMLWPQSALRVINAKPADAGAPRRRLSAPGTSRALATSGTNIDASPRLADGSSGKWTTFSAPHTVAILAGTKGTFTIEAAVTHDDQKLWGPDIPIALCESRITEASLPLPTRISSIVDTERKTTQFRDFSATYARKQIHTIEVDATAIEPRAEPYRLGLTLYVDEAENRCLDFDGRDTLLGWKGKMSVAIDIVVGTTPNFPKAESKALEFDGDFRVTNQVTFTFDPVLEADIELGVARLKKARVEVKGRASLEQQLKIAAQAAGNLDKTLRLVEERRFIKVYMAGSVPIVMTGTFAVDLRAQGNVTGQLDVTETFRLDLEDMLYGVRYEDGDWRETRHLRTEHTLKLVGDAQAEATLTLTLLPKMTLSLYETATARVMLAPQLKAEGAIRGRVVEELTDGGTTNDADYWLEKARMSGNIAAYVMADFGVMDRSILVWPEGAQPASYETFRRIAIVEDTAILGIPALSAALDQAARHPTDSGAVLIKGSATDVANPFHPTWGPKSYVRFSAWTAPKVIAVDSDGYQFVESPTGAPQGDFWVRFTKPGTYTVRLGGVSSMGGWARQIAEQVVRIEDVNGNGIPDFWEARYGASGAGWATADPDNDGRTNLEEWQAGTDPLVADTSVTITQVLDNFGARTGAVARGGSTDDATPALAGRLTSPLAAGHVLSVFDGAQRLGDAVVSGLDWTFTPSALAGGAHALSAVITRPVPALAIRSTTWTINIAPDEGLPLFAESFDRSNGTVVGNGWTERSYRNNENAGNVDAIDASDVLNGKLRVAHSYYGSNVDAGIRRPFEMMCGLVLSGTVQWLYDFSASAMVVLNGADRLDQRGLMLHLAPSLQTAHEVSIHHEGGVVGGPVSFAFERGVTYRYEWTIRQDCSSEARVWKSTESRPTTATTTSSAVSKVQRAGARLALFAGGGSGCCTYPGYDIRFDDLEVVTLSSTGGVGGQQASDAGSDEHLPLGR